MREIKNVIVEGISLVSKKNKPAVEKAEVKFALFKIEIPKKKIEKIKSRLQDNDRQVNSEQGIVNNKIEKIKRKLE